MNYNGILVLKQSLNLLMKILCEDIVKSQDTINLRCSLKNFPELNFSESFSKVL